MQSKNLIPVSIQRSATTFGLSTDLLARLPLLLILWSTCWLLTGCGFPPSLTSGPLLQTQPSNQACHVRLDDLSQESSEETFRKFFAERGATPIWHWLSDQVDYTQVVDPSIIHTDPTIREILSKYGPEEQAELKVGIKTYIQHRNHETVFRDFLFAHELDEIWERLNQAKGEDTLDLTGMLQACDPAVQSLVLQGVVKFILNHCPKLVVLNLSCNGLTQLPPTFGKLINLYEIYLNSNQLTQLPPTLADLNQLKIINLNDNQLTALPDSFVKLTQLERLYLGFNQLIAFPGCLENHTQLRILNLSANQLTQLPPTFVNLINLYTLDLSNNDLTTLPATFGNLNQLQELNIGANLLTALPDSFGELINLHKLYLTGNNLQVLPGCLQKLTKLKVFSVIYNPFLNPNAALHAPDILVTSDNLKLKPFPRQEYVRQHSLNSTFNYDFNREIFEIKRPDNATTYIHSYQRYPTILFIKKLGELTLFQPVPLSVSLSGREIAWHAYSEDEMIITKQGAINPETRQ